MSISISNDFNRNLISMITIHKGTATVCLNKGFNFFANNFNVIVHVPVKK
jgi:hypothetical protein